MSAAAVLASIFAGCEGRIEVRAIFPNRKVHQEYFQDPDAAARCADSYNGRANVYIGAATRLRESGTKEDVQEIPALWADCDTPGAVAKLPEFPFRPTIEIETSPGRRHVWWCLKEPLLVEHEGTIAKVEAVLRGIADVLGSDPTVAEIARVLRVSGTTNVKRQALCKLLYDDGPRYELDDFINRGIYRESKMIAGDNGHSDQKVDTATVLAGVQAGQRDTAIFKLASKCRALDAPIELAERLAVEAARNAEQPAGDPFTPDDARAKVRAAYRNYPAGTSRPESEETDPDVQSWPDPPRAAAYHGVLGDLVRAVEPYTEADPVAILVQLLIGFGNLVGGSPYFKVEATEHHVNEFVVLLGPTAGGRKGTALDQARRPLASVDEAWAKDRIQGGLASGEGLIHAVRDARQERRPIMEKGRCTGYEIVETDAGVSDKRLQVVESEFARVLKVMSREGATLSTIIRQAWDGPDLRVMAKQAGATATGAHISVIAHITPEELIRQLEDTEAASGFGNRFLWVCVKRSRFLPDGADVSAVDFAPLLTRLSGAVSFARRTGAMKRAPEARDLWRAEYPRLSTGRPGLLGSMLSRAEAHVLRLSMLYSLADASADIRSPHLQAALALWDYCERSAAFVFGNKLGDPTADELLRALRATPEGMSRTSIRDHFGRNKSAAEIGKALGVLARQGLAHSVTVKGEGGGRPVETWTASKAGEI